MIEPAAAGVPDSAVKARVSEIGAVEAMFRVSGSGTVNSPATLFAELPVALARKPELTICPSALDPELSENSQIEFVSALDHDGDPPIVES